MSSKSIFKIYSKKHKTNSSDSIFSIIGNSEPDLTKSLAFLLHYSEVFFKIFIKKVFNNAIRLDYLNYLISAEQYPDLVDSRDRRDIAIQIRYKEETVLIIIEAKSLNSKIRTKKDLINQLEKYSTNLSYSDVNNVKLFKTTMTMNHIDFTKEDNIYSVIWADIIEILNKEAFKSDYLLIKFKEEIMKSNNVKTYEEEIFCPPSGNTFNKIDELNIYCCPINYSTKEAIYLMPRIPVNSNETYLKNKYGITAAQIRGKGFVEAIYEIKDSFITDKQNIEAIEDEDLKKNIKDWFESFPADDPDVDLMLKVFVLGNKMEFNKPKFTTLQNNAYKAYYSLASVWGNELITEIE